MSNGWRQGCLKEGRKIETVEGTCRRARSFRRCSRMSTCTTSTISGFVNGGNVNRRGDMIVVRYADDTIVGFEHQDDAERFLEDLSLRMADFELRPPSRKRRGSHRVRQEGKLPAAALARSQQAGDVRLPWVHALLRDPTKRRRLRAGKDASSQADAGQVETKSRNSSRRPATTASKGARQMACPGASRLVGLLRRADERAGDHGVPAPSGRSLAPRNQAAGTEASARMSANE